MSKKVSLKILCLSSVILLGVLTLCLCIFHPKMHKPFQLNIIEYIIKINTDGSVTTTKSITTQTTREVNK